MSLWPSTTSSYILLWSESVVTGDDDDEGGDGGGRVDRQLVRMGYRFLVRGCKFL